MNTLTSQTKEKTKKIWLLIDNLDLEPLKYNLMHPEEEGVHPWTLEECDKVEVKYKQFLKLCYHYPEMQIVPDKKTDKFWHTHIFDSQMYTEDCNNIFGYYLHHYPYFGKRGEEDAKNLKTAFEVTQQLLYLHFPETESADNKSADCNAICGDGYIIGKGDLNNRIDRLSRPRPVRAAS